MDEEKRLALASVIIFEPSVSERYRWHLLRVNELRSRIGSQSKRSRFEMQFEAGTMQIADQMSTRSRAASVYSARLAKATIRNRGYQTSQLR